jgi:lysophospholipase
MRKWLALFFACGFLSLSCEAGNPPSFEEHYENTILPFYWAASEGKLYRPGNTELVYKKFEHPFEKAAIVFVTGWTETHLKYAELIWNLYQEGYSVYSIDNRGMGFSSRLTSNPQQVHVETVQDYVDDLHVFVEEIVRPQNHSNAFFVAHSLGGLITANYLVQHGQRADAAVFSAPLFELNTGKIPAQMAYRMTQSEIKKGNSKKYAMTQGDTTFEEASDFKKQKTTHSPERWKQKADIWKNFPYLLQGGSTNGWVYTVLGSTFSLLSGGWTNMPVPSLILEASEDVYVINRGHRKVCAQAKSCRTKKYKNSYHELFLEQEAVRQRALKDTLSFLTRSTSG